MGPARTVDRPAPPMASRIAIVALGAIALDGLSKLVAYQAAHAWPWGPVIDARNSGFSMGVVPDRFPFEAGLMLALLPIFGAWAVAMARRGVLSVWIPGLLIGGAAANISDRLLFGSVHDWLRAGPVVLNLADVMVFVAVGGIWLSGAVRLFRPSASSR